MDKNQLEIFLNETEDSKVKKKNTEEEKQKTQVVMDKEFITESGKILLKD